jgi:hypothetical protein
VAATAHTSHEATWFFRIQNFLKEAIGLFRSMPNQEMKGWVNPVGIEKQCLCKQS